MKIRPSDEENKCKFIDATQLRKSIDTLLASSDEEEEITVITFPKNSNESNSNGEQLLVNRTTYTQSLYIKSNDESSYAQPVNKYGDLDVTNMRMSFESLLASSDEELDTSTLASPTEQSISPRDDSEAITIPTKIKSDTTSNEFKSELLQSKPGLYVSSGKSTSTQLTLKNSRVDFIQPQLAASESSDELIHTQPPLNKYSDPPDELNILSLYLGNQQLGAAYYNMITSELFVMNDVIEDDFNYSTAVALYRHCQPQYVLTTNGAPDRFINTIKKLITRDKLDEEKQSTPSTASVIDCMARACLRLLSKSENNYENSYLRVNCLKLACEPDNATNAERVTFLNSILNFKSRMMIHALGLLLRYLDANWNKLALNPTGQAQYVCVKYIKLNDLVMIEEDSYKALNIMQSRFHPSLFKFGASSKGHGACLFTFLNRCQSRSGMQYLWKMMRHPTRNIETLRERFRAIQFFLHPDNQNVGESLKSCLKNMTRLTQSIINKYSAAQVKATDWKKFNTTISNILNIAEICGQCRDSAAIFEKIANSTTNEMHYIRYFIDHIVDFELSKKDRKFIVKAGVDPELDELKYKRQSLPQLLTEMATRELNNLPVNAVTCRMIYVPDIKYCLAITEWDGSPPSDDEEIPGLEFKFMINGLPYYKSDGARELDETIGDVLLKITRRQSQIMLRLVQYISKHIGPILNCIEYCAELDVLLAFSMVARDHNYTMPKVIESHVIDIKSGRHPLKELAGNFVANDTLSSDNSSFVKIFSGPNACGKTIYLKQVALIVYMTHIGCYVPAESATIGVVTHILTQMPSIESIAQNASSFLIDLRQVNSILYSSTPNCLIIMDEFGRGTAQIDALALLSSILKSFVDRGRYCPHTLIATHMHRTMNFIPETSIVQTQTFEFLMDQDNAIVFLYKLIPGSVTCSYAHAVARSAGLIDGDVTQSMEVFEYIKKGNLPPIRPEENRSNVLRYIVELISKTKDGDLDLEELKQWTRQANYRRR